jgi:hypothetical protein
MARANRAHLEDLPLDELEAVIFTEESRLCHLLIFGTCEEAARELVSHGTIRPIVERHARQGARADQ